MEFSRKSFLFGSALTTAVVAFGSNAILGQGDTAFAAPGIDLDKGFNTGKKCVENGFKYTQSGNIAQGPHCFATADRSTKKVLANVDSKKTLADLKTVEKWSPLNTSQYLARGSMSTRIVTDAPRHKDSKKMAQAAQQIPGLYNSLGVTTGSNVGGGVSAHDNIPIYTVDSSNPSQNFVNVSSTDSRVTNFDGIKRVNTGRIPLPKWAKPSDGGDKSLAIYDVATGIWRSYFHMIPTNSAKTHWTFSSGGYWYADDANNRRAGDSNYWLSLIQGSSSVVGLSNELTQIGIDEVRKLQINHMVSVTFANYPGAASFPAKQSDGNLPTDKFPVAPKAGQIFTFPKSMNIDKYGKDNGLDALTIAVMKAVQKHGGIVADRNLFCHAFNFENPYGIGEYAAHGKNAWKEDKTVNGLINGFKANRFPWAQTEWLPDNYAGVLSNAWTKDPVVPKQVFKDVDRSVIFKPEIEQLSGKGIVRGWSDGTYRPYEDTLRDAMIVFIYRAMGSPAYTPPRKSPFVDVPTSNVFYKEIAWAYHKGITAGWKMSNGTRQFRPFEPVKRDAVAAFLMRAAGEKPSNISSAPFSDVPKTLIFAREIAWMKQTGISTGWKHNNTYQPFANTKRDAMAAFVIRWMKHTNRL